jgi:hypothetical protein
MQRSASPELLDYAAFARDVLPVVPPRILVARPEVARWLLSERPMLAALLEGGGKHYCHFQDPAEDLIQPDPSYQGTLRAVVQRALAAAKAFEFAENERTAAAVYTSLVQLIGQLDQDRLWVSAFYALTLLPPVVEGVEGFCAREPSRLALRMLGDELAGQVSPRFPLPLYLRREARNYRSWLSEDLSVVENRLADLYGGAALRPAVDKLMALEPRDKRSRLKAWLADYDASMQRLADACERPHEEALRTIAEIDAEIGQLRKDPAREGTNPLLPLLMPPLAGTYQQFVLAEACFGMMDVLVTGAVYRDFVQTWPATLEELERFVGRPFAMDPFTGEPLEYTLSRNLPRVRTRAPRDAVRSTGLPDGLDVRRRLDRDDQNLKRVLRRLAEERNAQGSSAMDKPVPK